MRNLVSTIFVSWLAFGVIEIEKNKKTSNNKKIVFCKILIIVLWLLLFYEVFR